MSWGRDVRVACLAAALGLSVLFGEDALVAGRGKEVLVGTGDVAGCVSTREGAAAELPDRMPGTVFTVVDTSRGSGSRARLDHCHAAHDYAESIVGAEGYSGEPDKSYYSYDLGGWHVVALNSACEEVGECDEDSPMLRWLEEDLATNKKPCTLAYWRHLLFSSSPSSNNLSMWATWDVLYVAGADVVINAHEHAYERFGSQTPEGNPDPERGVREFVVGTEGSEPDPSGNRKPNSEVYGLEARGTLEFTLLPGGYEWEFVPAEKSVFSDFGSGACH